MSLLFNMLSRFVIAFLPRSKHLFIAAVTVHCSFWAQENKICHCFHCFSIYLPWSDQRGCHYLHFWVLSFKPAFSLSSFTFIKRLFNSSLLSAIRWCHLHIWGYWYFSGQSWFQLVIHPVQPFTCCTLHRSYAGVSYTGVSYADFGVDKMFFPQSYIS